MRYRRRRNPDADLSEVPVHAFRPSDPKEAATVRDYGRKYTDWHWSLKPKKVIHFKGEK